MKTAHAKPISTATNLSLHKVEATLRLLEQDATVPFIARYRKDQTGGMDETQIMEVKNLLNALVELEKRKEFILKTIAEQDQLTPELKQKIDEVKNLIDLEDLYLPYKQKRKTRGIKAKEKGLEPLAKLLMAQTSDDVAHLSQRFVRGEIKNYQEALAGARDIIAEWANERISARNKMRRLFEKEAIIHAKQSKKAKDAIQGKPSDDQYKDAQKYRDYFDYTASIKKSKSHRTLALLRGEKDGWLKLKIEPDSEKALARLIPIFVRGNNESSMQVKEAIEDAYKRLLRPSLETEIRNQLKEKADRVAIEVFAGNLRELLLASPSGAKKTMAIDPGFRSGCKVVCLNEKGDFLKYRSIFPHSPQNQKKEATAQVLELIKQYQIEVIAIGNGTAGRETETFIKNITQPLGVKIFMVNEDGASIYSASIIAREEFPDEDITVRGAISIGRRLMDPLAELVKIDAKSIGVGQYQYDVDQKALKDKLDATVESCVNSVGINVNTASKYILTYVSGLGNTLAQNILDYRTNNGRFSSRAALKKVPRMGDKSYEQSIGFLRVENEKNPLDNSAVHPENYPLIKRIAKDLNCSTSDLLGNLNLIKEIDAKKYIGNEIGELTFRDILAELAKPSRDPRDEAEIFEFDQNIKDITDVVSGMSIPGIVTNVTNFGAFVDIGIKQNGLIHISNLSDTFISDPSEILKVNQKIRAVVLDVDVQRNRIGLKLERE